MRALVLIANQADDDHCFHVSVAENVIAIVIAIDNKGEVWRSDYQANHIMIQANATISHTIHIQLIKCIHIYPLQCDCYTNFKKERKICHPNLVSVLALLGVVHYTSM